MRAMVLSVDEQTLDVCVGVLKRRGHELISAPPGLDPVATIENSAVLLLLLDVSSPPGVIGDLPNLVTRVRVGSPGISIVAIAADVHNQGLSEALRSGVNDFILLPLDSRALSNRLFVAESRVLERWQARALVEVVPDLMFRVSREGVLIEATIPKAFTAAVSVANSTAEVLGALLPFLSEQLLENGMARVREALDGGEVHILKFELPLEPRSRSYTARFVRSGTDEVLVLVRDLTPSVRAEKALRRSRRDFRQVIEQFPEGVGILVGSEGGVSNSELVYANPALLAATGRSLIDDGLQRTLLAWLSSRPEAKRSHSFRTSQTFVRPDGETISVELAWVRNIQFEGAEATLVVVRDVTQRERLRSQLMLADRMASLGTLAAGVAHEVNSPLAYVIANLGFLAEELAGNVRNVSFDDLRELVAEAAHGAERVRRIVRDLKTFSRGDSDEVGPVDVKMVLESAMNMAYNEIRHKAQLVTDIVDTPPVLGNEARLGQVFLNILINAAQAFDSNGATRNEVRVVTRETEDGWVLVEISDTGQGIQEEILGRVFDLYFTTKPVGVGTGLGLSICHSIVTGLGGEIEIESAKGEGTTLRITLPVAKSDVATCRPVDQPPAPELEPLSILVVDDDVRFLRSLGRVLDHHNVITVSSGQQAVDLLRAQDFDVVLCDLFMPEITGMDLYDVMRNQSPGMEQRIVFMTGGAFTPRSRDFLATISNPRLSKPFELTELVDAMTKAQLAM